MGVCRDGSEEDTVAERTREREQRARERHTHLERLLQGLDLAVAAQREELFVVHERRHRGARGACLAVLQRECRSGRGNARVAPPAPAAARADARAAREPRNAVRHLRRGVLGLLRSLALRLLRLAQPPDRVDDLLTVQRVLDVQRVGKILVREVVEETPVNRGVGEALRVLAQ